MANIAEKRGTEYREKKDDQQGDEWRVGGKPRGRGRIEGGRLRNLAQLGAGTQAGHDARPDLFGSQYGISRRISCTSAYEHTSRAVSPFFAENLGFPFLVFSSLAQPFADWRGELSNNL